MELDILKGLNDEQREAVTTIDGYIRVIAGAGRGKTRALTHRYAYLVKECGISPSSILSVTFTNKAAQEMKTRIRSMIGDHDLGHICTFHGLCVHILREDIHYLHYPSNFTILDQDDQKLLLSDVYDTLKINDYTHPYYEALNEIAKSKSDNLDYYVSNVTDPNGFNPMKSNMVSEYLKLQRKNYALDFNDLLYFTIYLLENFVEVREKWQDIFEYIQVDEFQDVSDREYEIVNVLSQKHKNLFIVGDPDQTIYSWRGANVNYILDFKTEFQNVYDIPLLKNYRSSKEIIDCSNSLISINKNRIEKSLIAATDSQSENKTKVIHYHAKTMTDESQWIAKEIKNINKQGCDFKDIAILYRARYSVSALELSLKKEDIPYKICDGISFYSRKEIKTIIAYFTFVLNQDDLSFIKIINTPMREMGIKRMNFLKSIAQNKEIPLYQALKENINNPIFNDTKAKEFLNNMDKIIAQHKNLKVSEIADIVIKITGYERDLMTSNDDEEFNSIAELKNQIEDAEKNRGEKMSLQDYLDDVALATSVDISKDKSKVSLMTIHSAKGLEFKNVFICEMNEGSFPSAKIESLAQMEEERRLAYVALTRAEDRLYLTDAEGMSASNPKGRYTSRFIYNISPELLEPKGEYSEHYQKKEAMQTIFDSENKLSATSSYKIGETISHPVYGKGTIKDIDVSNDSYMVEFSDGVRSIGRIYNKEILNENNNDTNSEKNETATEKPNEKIDFSVGDQVKHNVFGEGIIKSINSHKQEISVKFEKYETERKINDLSKLSIISNSSNQGVSEIENVKSSENEKMTYFEETSVDLNLENQSETPSENDEIIEDFIIRGKRLVSYRGKKESVTIPSSVTNIAAQAFVGNNTIKEIIIPESVSLIGGLAFANCSNLQNIIIKNENTVIGEGAFDRTEWYNKHEYGLLYCGNILYSVKGKCNPRVDIKERTTSISPFAFYDHKELISVTIPESVKTIHSGAFMDCTSLKEIKFIGNKLECIGDMALRNCKPIIYCLENSYAYSFAIQHNIKFILNNSEK